MYLNVNPHRSPIYTHYPVDMHECESTQIPNTYIILFPNVNPHRSPHYDIKVMSVGSLLEESGSQAVVWRGPRKTALIKRFMKDTFWGRLDYIIFGIFQ